MEPLNTDSRGPLRKRPGFCVRMTGTLRIDMTPMVDLGFLLISFFVITTELSKPGGMTLIMPKDSTSSPTELGESYAATILLDGEKMYYYDGSWDQAVSRGNIQSVNTKEFRERLIRKKIVLNDTTRYKEGSKGLMLLIKASPATSYRKLVNIMDEAAINDIKKQALVRISPVELSWLQSNR